MGAVRARLLLAGAPLHVARAVARVAALEQSPLGCRAGPASRCCAAWVRCVARFSGGGEGRKERGRERAAPPANGDGSGV